MQIRMLKARLVVFALALALHKVSSLVPYSTSPFYRTTHLRMSSEAASPTKLDPSETALVLIEYQNEFTTEGEGSRLESFL